MIKTIAAMILATLLASQAHAGSKTNAQELTFFRTGDQPNVLVVVGGAEDFANSEGCNSGKAALDPRTTHSKEMYSHLLAAYMANKKVKFYGNGCINADGMKYIKIEYVYFGD